MMVGHARGPRSVTGEQAQCAKDSSAERGVEERPHGGSRLVGRWDGRLPGDGDYAQAVRGGCAFRIKSRGRNGVGVSVPPKSSAAKLRGASIVGGKLRGSQARSRGVIPQIGTGGPPTASSLGVGMNDLPEHLGPSREVVPPRVGCVAGTVNSVL
jgi:hypothetical protein